MTIPNSLTDLRSGAPGRFSHDGPRRVAPYTMNSATETDNVFGRAFTLEDGASETVEAGGGGAFIGILVEPAFGIGVEYLQNGEIGGICSMGDIYVELVPAVEQGKVPVVPVINSRVYFVVGTGELTVDPDDQASVPTNHVEIIGARVVRHLPHLGLAQIALTGPA